MRKSRMFLAAGGLIVLAGCALMTRTLPLEEQNELIEDYENRTAWARSTLLDLKGAGKIERDSKVEIVSLGLHLHGSLVLEGPRRKRIVFGLDLPREFTSEQFEEKVHQVLWFDPPDQRYEEHLERWGRRTAQAIKNHEVFKGMDREAALYSLGYPAEISTLETSAGLQEHWSYRELQDGRVEKFEVVIVNDRVNYWE
jgi:hypothetical protein